MSMPLRRRTGRRLLAVLVAACWLLLPARPASAHAVLLSTTPATGTTVEGAPKEVVLTFSEPVKITFGGVRVFDSSLKRVDRGQARFVDDHTVAIGLSSLGDGSYVVAWRVVSADTHPVRGAFTFAVGAPTISQGSQAGKLDTALEGFGSAPKPVLAAAAAARALGYLTALLLFGTLVFVLVAWRPRTPGGAADRAMTRTSARLLQAVWPAAVVASLLVLVTEAATEAGVSLVKGLLPSTLGPVLGSTLGHVWIVRMVLLAALLPFLLRLVRSAERPPAGSRAVAEPQPAGRSVGAMAATPQAYGMDGSRGPSAARGPATWAAAALAGAVAATPAFWGHATTADNPFLAHLADTTHLLAVSAWVGGLFCLLLLVPRVLRDASAGERAAALARTVPRFSKLALASVTLLVGSGTYLAIEQVRSWKALFDTTYGQVLVAKIVALGLALLLAAFNLVRTQRRLRAAADRPGDSEVWARRLRRVVGGEAVVATVIVVLAAVLVSQAPPRNAALGATPGTYAADRIPVGPDLLDLRIYPTRTGQKTEIHTVFTTPAGAPDEGIAEVTGSLTLVDKDLGPFRVTANQIAPGHFIFQGPSVSFPAPGTWRFELSMRRGEFDEFSHTVDFPVG